MSISLQLRSVLCLSVLTASSAAFGQEALTVTRPGPHSGSLPFQVRPVTNGLEVIEYTGAGHLLRPGDIITWAATPDRNDVGAPVTSSASLEAEVLARQDDNGDIALWVTRGTRTPDWVFISLASGSGTFLELPEELGGISLLPGFRATIRPPGRRGEFRGGISGPDGMDIEYSIWPVRQGNGRRASEEFVSDARLLAEEHRQWFREQDIGSELVQLALSNEDRLMVSYPDRGVNMLVAVNGPQQLADALLIMLSIPNKERHISWPDAVNMIEQCDVSTVTQYHSGVVRIRMGSEMTYHTREPEIDAVFDVLRQCGKYDSVGIITE